MSGVTFWRLRLGRAAAAWRFPLGWWRGERIAFDAQGIRQRQHGCPARHVPSLLKITNTAQLQCRLVSELEKPDEFNRKLRDVLKEFAT
jgi:hypothetical protein